MNDKQSILIHKRTKLSMNIETNENNVMFLNTRLGFTDKEHLKIDKPIANYYISAFLKENDLISTGLVETNENDNELSYRYKVSIKKHNLKGDKMDKRVKDMIFEFTIGGINLEVSIYEHDMGINVLDITAEYIDKYNDNNKYETLLDALRVFNNTKLASILNSNNIDIVGIRDRIASSDWCSLEFYVDHLDNIAAFKTLFKEAQSNALANGLIPFGSEFSSVTVLEYQAAIDALNSIVARMLAKGYELTIQDSNSLLNTGYEELCDKYNKEFKNE